MRYNTNRVCSVCNKSYKVIDSKNDFHDVILSIQSGEIIGNGFIMEKARVLFCPKCSKSLLNFLKKIKANIEYKSYL